MFSRETFSILKKSKSLQTTLAAETHLAEGYIYNNKNNNNKFNLLKQTGHYIYHLLYNSITLHFITHSFELKTINVLLENKGR
jgi:hypothetical protein